MLLLIVHSEKGNAEEYPHDHLDRNMSDAAHDSFGSTTSVAKEGRRCDRDVECIFICELEDYLYINYFLLCYVFSI